jgi:uncharacterized protein (UPF0261 family)
MLPLKGVSAIDAEGQPLDDPGARSALFDAIRRSCAPIELAELDHHINAAELAEAAAGRSLELIGQV